MKLSPLLAAFSLLGAALGAQEPPPPPMETDLPPGLRLVEPRAEDLMRKMAALLTGSKAFALEAEEVFDEVPEHSPRRQLANRRHVAVRRPDRLAGDASGDAVNRSIWYDGKTLSTLDKEQNVWAAAEVPPTVDGAMDAVLERTGMVIPLADFLYTDVYDRFMSNVQRGVYLGIHEAAGVACHHLSFEQDSIDWQIWVDAGSEPLPRKLVIVYKAEDEVPQYSVTIRKWNLKATLPDDLFRFEPPQGARKIDLPTEPPADGAEASGGGAIQAQAAPGSKQEKKP